MTAREHKYGSDFRCEVCGEPFRLSSSNICLGEPEGDRPCDTEPREVDYAQITEALAKK